MLDHFPPPKLGLPPPGTKRTPEPPPQSPRALKTTRTMISTTRRTTIVLTLQPDPPPLPSAGLGGGARLNAAASSLPGSGAQNDVLTSVGACSMLTLPSGPWYSVARTD